MADNVLAQVPRKRYPTLDEQMRSDIVNYLSRLKSDFVTSGERAGQGLGQVIDDGNYLEGVPRVVLGGLGALSAPVSAAVSPVLGPLLQPVGQAVDTYVGQPVERATGYPADITNELFLTGVTAGAAPVLRPALRGSGNFLAKVGDAAEAGLNRVGYTARPQAGTFFSGGGPVKLADDEGILAYHGSPHSFDKFSMDKIGTGEGAQAYGHGLYFAQHEGTAQSYRDVLSSNRAPSQEDLSKLSFDDQIKVSDAIQSAGERAGFNTSSPDAFWMVVNKLAGHESKTMHPVHDKAMLALDEVVKHVPEDVKSLVAQNVTPAKGSMYQVRLNVKPDELLDWDKPLTGQPDIVQKALAGRRLTPSGVIDDRPLGEVLDMPQRYKDGSDILLTDDLKKAGIKGIRYLDAGSRDGRGGTYNYVIFDDSLIDILKKYGIPMTAGAGGAMMVSGEAMPPELAAQLQGGT